MTIRAVLIALPLMFLGWLSTLVVVALLTDDAPAYVVVLPKTQMLEALPGDVSVLAASPFSLTVASESEGFVKSLYNMGARLVLPAGLPGCLPLPKA
ncbi:hypothetical protein [Ruegeria lacuscaerulensis]|uniref:hypothetical protein n=1 Tax=Ruegeria lacuscaerulensis TaxID=55218 RepID=UPI00147AD0DE|nr:hypothetical protein [Ruegeria lacuscaerulensis]